MTIFLLFDIQLLIWLPSVAPWQFPFEHLPPPSQGVPSRKYCCMLQQTFLPNSGDAQESTQPWEEQE